MEQKKNINSIFINFFTRKGKKVVIEKILNKILIDLKKKTKQKPNFIFIKALKSLSPKLKVIDAKSKRKRAKKKSIIIYLNDENQIRNGIRFLIKTTKLNNMSNEIIKVYQKKSKSLLLKQQFYKQIKRMRYNLKI